MARTTHAFDSLPQVFSTAEALAIGAPQPQTGRYRLTQICQGIWAKPDPSGAKRDPVRLHLQAAAALARTIPDAVIAGPTAALLHGMPLPRVPSHIHLLRGSRAAGSARAGIHIWREMLNPEDVVRIPGFAAPVTSMRRTLLTLTQVLDQEHLTVILDWMVRHPRPYVENRSDPYDTLEGLGAWASRQGRRRGLTRLRLALGDSRVGSDSPRETQLRLAIVAAGLPEPTCNPVVLDSRGRYLGEPDLAFEDLRIAIEYQGRHHWEDQSVRRDITKGDRFRREGWQFLELSAEDAREGWSGALEKIRWALDLAEQLRTEQVRVGNAMTGAA